MTPHQDLRVDFDCDDRFVDYDFVEAFWEASRPWLAERGYTLFDESYQWRGKIAEQVTCTVPRFPVAPTSGYPFAYFGGDRPDVPVPSLSADLLGRIGYAQDSLHRHVALKLVKEDSAEYNIARYLNQELAHLPLSDFQGVLPPIDFLHLEKHYFLVMPRWGGLASDPWFSTVREVLDYIRCWLKGLTFLHKHHIVHRDVKFANCLVNHFSASLHQMYSPLREQLRTDGHLIYAIIDFDLSIMFPLTATSEECRLPIDYSWDGSWSRPYDTRQGELDYDPFVYDVGCLGVLFCQRFQHLTHIVPMLAPLMDRMITQDLNRRFTASEALEFFEEFTHNMTVEELQISPEPRPPQRPRYDHYDRWQYLPEEFVRDWHHFREPKPSYQIRVLRRICDCAWGRTCVQCVRRAIKFAKYIFGIPGCVITSHKLTKYWK